MRRLSPDELKSRLRFDYEICQSMFGTVFSGKAYRNTSDLQLHRNPITSVQDGHLALKYSIDFHVRTLIGPGQYSDLTIIGFDLDVADYPFEEPHSWVISTPIPYSPHFKRGAPVCIGPIWETANGKMLLGELLVHVARILNWDKTTSSGYHGWNSEAAAYHRRVFGENPITIDLPYSLIPADLVPRLNSTLQEASKTPRPLFRPHSPHNIVSSELFSSRSITDPSSVVTPKLFRGKGSE